MISRAYLIVLLEGEGYNEAAMRIYDNEDPVSVLNEMRPFIARYNDAESRATLGLLQDICAGRVTVH